jgi:probable F420-dependent oxidoreductase
MDLSLNLLGLTRKEGSFADVLWAARLAEQGGFAQVSLGEHIGLVPSGFDKYPGGFPRSPDFPYYEPITALAAIAAVTKHVRLSTNILISALRPPLLLAKQIATLDAISGGRTELAWGPGWHEEEFAANGSIFKGRHSIIEEQITVCRAVWGTPPATHNGPRYHFDHLYSMPLPPQGRNLPIWLGMDPTPRNIDRIARLADGWAPLPMPPAEIRIAVERLHEALAAAARDPASFPVRATLLPVKNKGRQDLAATLATMPAYREAGVTMLICDVQSFIDAPTEVEPFIASIIAARDAHFRVPLG